MLQIGLIFFLKYVVNSSVFLHMLGESILIERVYCDCPISINHMNTIVGIVELDMIDLMSF